MRNEINFLLRSMLYVPTYKKKFFEKISNFNADAIILDLEDSVPAQFKEESRKNIAEFLNDYEVNHGKKLFVRLNSIESKLLLKDLEYVLSDKVDGFLLTKIYSADDMVYYDKLISQYENDNGLEVGHFMFAPLIETASAVINAYPIAKSTERVVALVFGGEDFLNDIGGFHGIPPKGLDFPRAQIVLAARSVRRGVLPIDTPYLKIHDDIGFQNEERLSFEMGFAGVQCIHPSQIELAHTCFMPTYREIEESKKIVEAIDETSRNGSGVAIFQGNLIGPPMEKRARKVLELLKATEKIPHD